ncbi:CRISPR-associated endonuclease Cas2 [Spirulina subsalsa]|uniref:CRISPR-associated endonuclease Cas2 n=1 Tax=Spirulina subsalsa TaxID=54311 RepID=UPI0038B3A30A
MAELKNWYLVCYDIRCPKRWRKAYKVLEGYGERLQYSIFRCWLSLRMREKLRWELERVLTENNGIQAPSFRTAFYYPFFNSMLL